MRKPIVKRINKDKYEIGIIGNRDPRGLDNTVFVEVNKEDELIITVPKANRCYRFKETDEDLGYIKVIAN